MAARIGLDFSGIEELLEQLIELDKDVDLAVENALEESKKYVTPLVESAMQSHIETGATRQAIDSDSHVENDSVSAFIDVGFDIDKEINESGYPVSIFLMYGTPRQAPDKKLYNAIYGSATKRKVREIQQEEFYKVLMS